MGASSQSRSVGMLIAASGLLGSLLACPKAPPSNPNSQVDWVRHAFRVPPGCEANLSGQYVHDSDSSYRYLGSDDGGTLVLRVLRTFDDAGVRAFSDAGTAVVMYRQLSGFSGAVYAQGFFPIASCEVQFPTEVVACDDAGIVVSSASRASVDERCQPAKETGESARREEGTTLNHRLVRQ